MSDEIPRCPLALANSAMFVVFLLARVRWKLRLAMFAAVTARRK
jgi:hypothetical protein